MGKIFYTTFKPFSLFCIEVYFTVSEATSRYSESSIAVSQDINDAIAVYERFAEFVKGLDEEAETGEEGEEAEDTEDTDCAEE